MTSNLHWRPPPPVLRHSNIANHDVSDRVKGRIHGAIVAATGRSDRRGDRRGDDLPVYTLQATSRRNDRQLVARLNMFS